MLTERRDREGGKEYRYVLYIHNSKTKYSEIFLGTTHLSYCYLVLHQLQNAT